MMSCWEDFELKGRVYGWWSSTIYDNSIMILALLEGFLNCFSACGRFDVLSVV